MSSRTCTRALSLLASFIFVFGVIPAGAIERSGESPGDIGGGGGWGFNRVERCLMRKVNKTRSRHGLARLDWDKQVGYVARRHAKSMAASHAVYHDGDVGNEITRWRTLAQNSGAGFGCRKIFWAFMKSSAHRANILGQYRHVGVGADWSRGKLYVQQVFEWRYDPGNVYRYP